LLGFVAPRQGAILAQPDSEKPGRRDSRQEEWRRAWALAATLGWNLVVSICLGGALGYWADRSWGTQPWMTVAGFTLGIIAGLYQFIMTINRPPK